MEKKNRQTACYQSIKHSLICIIIEPLFHWTGDTCEIRSLEELL